MDENPPPLVNCCKNFWALHNLDRSALMTFLVVRTILHCCYRLSDNPAIKRCFLHSSANVTPKALVPSACGVAEYE